MAEVGEDSLGQGSPLNVLVVEIAGGPDPGGAVHRTLKLAAALQGGRITVRLLLLSAGMSQERLCTDYGIPAGSVEWIPCLNRRFHVAAPHFRTIQRCVAAADVVCFSSFLWGAAPWAWLAARRAGKPWIVSPMGVLPYFGRSLMAKRVAHTLFGRRLLAGSAAVVAVTPLEAQALRPFVAPAVPITVVPNGIDLDAMTLPGQQIDLGSEPYALYLGRLDPVKGLDILLQAIAATRSMGAGSLRLLVAGQGLQRDELGQMVVNLGLQSQVAFLGEVAVNAKFDLIRRACFVVIPSRRDAMTQVALEAGLVGRPLLLSRACGFDEAIDCGGALGADPTVDSLADGWIRMQRLAGSWDEMGGKLRALVHRNYSWKAVAQRLCAVIEGAMPCR